jgi:hypothetical protein
MARRAMVDVPADLRVRLEAARLDLLAYNWPKPTT